jgi:hypothetical protein
MTTQNTQNQQRKPIFYGDLPQAEYDAVLVKVTPMAPKPNMTPSVKVDFLIDFPEAVAFVSGFMNQTFKSGDKTATWLKNLGISAPNGITPLDQLKGKKCKIYVVPGNKVFSQKYGKEIQYYKIAALTPANSVVPQVIGSAPQAQVAQPAPVQQVAQPVVQPVVQPMTQPVANNPFVAQTVPAAQPVYAVPQAQPTVQPQPVVVPQGNNMAAQLAQVAQTAIQASATQPVPQQIQQQVAQSLQAQPAPVAQPVAQPLPNTTVSLDF